MKTLTKLVNLKILYISICINIFSTSFVFAESEPNDNYSTANVLGANASDVGSLSGIDVYDWWKVTISTDGGLVINTTSDASLELDLRLYDINGTLQIASYDTSWGIHEATHFNNLLPGTYYIQANRYSGAGSYTIFSVFTACPLTVDPENNDSVAAAITLATNGSTTGHLGYYSNGYYDIRDWWQVTVPSDGKLLINTTSDNTLDIDLRLYDIDGKSQIASYDTSVGIHEATHYNNLLPGTYYVDAFRYSGYGSYTINSIFTATSLTNDVENNDSSKVAIFLAINDSNTGHLGFYSSGYKDPRDWWKVAVPADGKLVINTSSDNTLDIDLRLYDVDGVTQIASYDTSVGIHEATHFNNLMPGIYFVEAKDYSGYGSYTISSVFIEISLANDIEINDSSKVASVLALSDTSTGHLGFYSGNYTDPRDWWKVTVIEDGRLVVNTTSDSTLDIDLRLYDVDGITQIASYDTSVGIHEATHFNNLMQGTYFIEAKRYAGYGSYTINSVFTPAALTGDPSINDSIGGAIFAPLATANTGHIGYYTNGYTDTHDWWYFTLSNQDSVKIIVETISNGDALDMNIYKAPDFSNVYIHSGMGGQFEIVNALLPMGTYYLDLYKYADYGSYTLTVKPKQYTGIDNYSDKDIGTFSIAPNPFNTETVISFNTNSTNKVSVILIDLLGKEIGTLFKGTMQEGAHQIYLNAQNLQNGVYLCKLQVGNTIKIQRIVISK